MKARLVGLGIAFLIILALHSVMEVSTERDPSSVILALEVAVMTTLFVAVAWDHIANFANRAKAGSHSFKDTAYTLVLGFAISVAVYLTAYGLLRTPNLSDAN